MKGDVNARSVDGATKLFDAAVSGDVAAVKRLLARGADPNIPENNGITPLMEAASWGRLRIITLLVRGGAEVNARDNFGDSALDYAESERKRKKGTARQRQANVIKLLRALGKGK